MAINDLGREAVSFTGSQAGIVTDTTPRQGAHRRDPGDRVQEALDEGKIVIVAGFQGVSTTLRRDDARPRRLRHDRGRARCGAGSRRLRDLHRRRRASITRRPADRRATRASSTAGLLRGDARARSERRARARAALGRVRSYPRRQDPRPLVVRRLGRGHVGRQGGGHARAGDHLRGCPRHERGEGDDPRRARQARRRRRACSARSPTPGSTST